MTIRYCIKRLLVAMISLFIVTSVVFFLLRLMPIEGYFNDFDSLTDLQIQNGIRKLGLDKPLIVQWKDFFIQLFHGNLGIAHRYRRDYPVSNLLADKMPISFMFGMISMVISVPIGFVFGVIMSQHKEKPIGYIGQGYIIAIQAIPAAIYYLVIQMQGSSLFGVRMIYRIGEPSSAVLPIISLALPSIAGYAMCTERFMLEAYEEEYVLTAKAKGVPRNTIAFKHVLRNAVLPLVQQLPSSILATLCGSLYIESIYSIPGMGKLLVDGINLQDNELVQGVVLVYTTLGIAGMLLGDILTAMVDPRIKFEGKKNG